MDSRRPECQHLDTRGATLRLRLAGQGPPLILLHGGPGVGDYLGDSVLVDWLAGHYSICAYDQRGCRASASSGPFTLDANAEDIEALRLHLGGQPITLLGHSWGAFLALYYASGYPDGVRRLVLVSPLPPRTGWEPRRQRTLEARHTDSQRVELQRIEARIARTRDPGRRQELYLRLFNAALPSYLAPIHRHKAPRIEWYSRDVNTQTMADLHRAYADRQWETGLRRFRAPTLAIHGREDMVPFSAVQQIQDLVPHAELIRLDDCGHFPWLETPARFHHALDGFLLASA